MDIKGIEVSSEIYGLKDEVARESAESASDKVGTLSNLATTVKTNIVSAINELVASLANGLAQKKNVPSFSRNIYAWGTGRFNWGNHTECFIQLGNNVGTSTTSQLHLLKGMPNAYYSIYGSQGITFLIKDENGVVFQQSGEANNNVIVNWLD